jgi:sulfur carrier protein ThiS
MKCLFINNEGAGFADHIDVADGTTVAALFAKQLPGRRAEDFLIRVNRQPTSADQFLAEGDRISITATKIAGATRRVVVG